MTEETYTEDWCPSVAFRRLHVLASRGYRPLLCEQDKSSGAIRLRHPLGVKHSGPPVLTLWSDGTVATPDLLWPDKYVPTENGSPDWQRFIAAGQDDVFQSFARSVAPPTVWENCRHSFARQSKKLEAKWAVSLIACGALASVVKEAVNILV